MNLADLGKKTGKGGGRPGHKGGAEPESGADQLKRSAMSVTEERGPVGPVRPGVGPVGPVSQPRHACARHAPGLFPRA